MPDLPEMHYYLDQVLLALSGELQPDHKEEHGKFWYPDQGMFPGFRMGWNAPDVWAYGLVVRWDVHAGWLFYEPGYPPPFAKLIDELVPYPELVADALKRLLNHGPAGLPLEGAVRWPAGEALIASLDSAS